MQHLPLAWAAGLILLFGGISERLASLPFSAGRLDDRWSAALSARGVVEVYADSVVITTSRMTLRASFPIPETAEIVIDSISAGLGAGESSWSVVRQSPAIRVDTALVKGEEWTRRKRRFVIPIDSGIDVSKTWPLFQVHLSAPVTQDNPYGQAWTYAHERKGFFDKLSAR